MAEPLFQFLTDMEYTLPEPAPVHHHQKDRVMCLNPWVFAIERIRGALRLTIGRNNTDDEIDYAIKIIPEAVEMLRKAGNNG